MPSARALGILRDRRVTARRSATRNAHGSQLSQSANQPVSINLLVRS